VEIVGFVVSPQHRYGGRPSDGARPAIAGESPDRIELRAHLGIVGDRYFGTRHTHASVTLISADAAEQTLAAIGIEQPDLAKARRNIIVRGVDVESLVDTTFTLDSGEGAVRFASRTRANPCAWMDEAFGPGARDALRGHAGIRAEPLDDGVLCIGPVTIARLIESYRDQS
jgi:MOSC domain-containing protein YiiM